MRVFRTIGELLQTQLTLHQITAKTCADDISASHSHLYEIMRGQRKLSPLMALKLERYFGVDGASWLHEQTQAQLQELRIQYGSALATIKPRDRQGPAGSGR